MTDKHEEAAKRKALAADYANKLKQYEDWVRQRLSKAEYDFFRNHGTSVDVTISSAISQAMDDPNIVPSAYISGHLKWMFGTVIPHSDKDSILYFADRLREYPYSDSYSRRSFRSGKYSVYTTKLRNLIRAYGFSPLNLMGSSLEKLLNKELPEDAQAYLDEYSWRGCGYNAWQIAYALDQHQSRIEEAIRRILTEENGSGMMTSELIRGVLISHRSDFHELLGKLLLAAKLQEGLRQSICEQADCGTKEGFLSILKVIEEHNLIRFSSVKRAVGTWLGILSNESSDLERISAKSVRLILDCLENESICREYLASEDAMQIYVALWRYGAEDIEQVAAKIAQIAENGTHHQLLVAGYFTANSEIPRFSHQVAKRVLKKYHDKEDILAVWLPRFMPTRFSMIWDSLRYGQPFDYQAWFESKEELDEYYELFKTCYASFSGKTKTFSPCIFPWHEVKLEKSDFVELLCAMAAISEDESKIDEACGWIKECSSERRHTCFSALMRNPATKIQRRTMLEGLVDKETYTRKAAYDRILKTQLSDEEYCMMEEYLRFKGADIRKSVMTLLMKQEDTALEKSIARLLKSNKEDIRLGGLDMISQLKKDENRKEIAASFTEFLAQRAGMPDLPAKEKLLLDTLVPADAQKKVEETALFTERDKYLPSSFDADYTELCAQAFAECFPDSELPDLIRGKTAKKGVLESLKSVVTGNTVCQSAAIAAEDLLSLSRLIDEHKTDSFVNSRGETVLLGNVNYATQLRDQDGKFPLLHLWKDWISANALTHRRILCAALLHRAYVKKTSFSEDYIPFVRAVFGKGYEYGKALPYSEIIEGILSHICQSLPKEDMIRLASALAIWFIRCVPEDKVISFSSNDPTLPMHWGITHHFAHKQFSLFYQWLRCEDDANLKYIFPLTVAAAERCAKAYQNLPGHERRPYDPTLYGPRRNSYLITKSIVDVKAYIIAAYRGIITEPQLYECLLEPEKQRDALELITAIATSDYEKGKQISAHDLYEKNRNARKVKEFFGKEGDLTEEDIRQIRFISRLYEKLIPVILASELFRGDSEATYTGAIKGIARIYGAKYFAEILSAMGKDTLDRSACYVWGSVSDRKSSLSYLLSVCIPADGDCADTLREALAGKKITTRRLIEAALFSPEWIPIIGTYIGIDSFESVCYYFMAHMNERFDDKRKAMIAKFTPLSEEELNLGAFDVNWFRAAYASIGEKEFDLIYDSAKYISDGIKHSRARKYADAALGKFDVAQTEKTISDKRNKDLLMAYALIPLQGEDDICRRYLYIQKFRKESKQFGSQRMANEGKAVEMALTNLAVNAGYADTMRLTLRMETKVIDDSRALLEEQIVDGISLKITLDENGKATLVSQKDGKQLKNVPAKLKKHDTVVALTAMVKTLTEQYRRARVMLERSMEDGVRFTFGELSALSAHPVVYPMLSNLVLVSGDAVGFLTEQGLMDAFGVVQKLADTAEIRIAHPFDLYQRGVWRNYQKYLFENQIAQPFRQIFRELYIKTEEELQMLHSLRYAGNQIQPAKTIGALKSRRWIADIEDGLQKVYYKENIIAQIYALADWFSPADIEAPTLEWVCFTNRQTGKAIKIADVPDIIFSEVMRDVDLAVSIAHAGGVDPETSHSTMEMRAAILSFVLPMFRIGNVKLEGNHAIVDGKLAEYSIHLGSGVVHQIGGAMIPVLPVHSQHKGKIFLPFADEDPKTAEIISKVLMFAEDDKIKDPMILSSIAK